MTEGAWNRFVWSVQQATSGDLAAPQVRIVYDGQNRWKSWPLEWDVSRLYEWSGDWNSKTHFGSSSNDFWCPGATLVTGLDSFIIMNLTKPTETGKTWMSTKLSKAIAEVNIYKLYNIYILY